MRGCFAVLVLGVAFSLGAVWIAGPPIASGIVTMSLGLAGFEAERTEVIVAADPPPILLTGRADRVRIMATNASFGGLTAATAEVDLIDVLLVDRRAQSVSGRLDGVVVGASDERLAVSSITFDGSGDGADASALVPADSIVTLASRAVLDATGQAPESVGLLAPDVLALTVGGLSVQARLAADAAGNLVALGMPGASGAIVLVRAASTAPFELEDVAVEGADVVVRGKLDVGALLR